MHVVIVEDETLLSFFSSEFPFVNSLQAASDDSIFLFSTSLSGKNQPAIRRRGSQVTNHHPGQRNHDDDDVDDEIGEVDDVDVDSDQGESNHDDDDEDDIDGYGDDDDDVDSDQGESNHDDDDEDDIDG